MMRFSRAILLMTLLLTWWSSAYAFTASALKTASRDFFSWSDQSSCVHRAVLQHPRRANACCGYGSASGFTFYVNIDLPVGSNTVRITATDIHGENTTQDYTVPVVADSGESFLYDLAGNLTYWTKADGTQVEYKWDAANRLRGIEVDSVLIQSFEYDGAGRMTRATDASGNRNDYYWDGLERLGRENTDLSPTVYRRYLTQGFTESLDGAAAQNYYTLRDHLGSTREVLDGTYVTVAKYDYSAWGEVEKLSGTVDADRLYTGHLYFADSDTPLHLAPYRAYQTELGRWLSRDLLGETGPDGTNTYGYVQNRPINGIDPTGLWLSSMQTATGVAVTAALFSPGVANAPEPGGSTYNPGEIEGTCPIDNALLAGTMTLVANRVIGPVVGAIVGKVSPVFRNLFRRSADEVGDLVPSGVCFTAGTLVLTSSGYITIESIEVGQRVLTSDENTDQNSYTEVDPSTWRLITLRMLNPDGSNDVLELNVLRSLDWISQHNASASAEIFFVLEEMGLEGLAKVVAIEPCPMIEEGAGRVVLSTVTHLNGYVMEIAVEAASELLEPTETHRLFSVDRNDWIPAKDLLVGEKLKTIEGSAEILSINRKAGVHRVYNIEVETDHNYFVSEQEILSHNTNPCGVNLPTVKKGIFLGGKGPIAAGGEHAVARGVERGVFGSAAEATSALKSLTASLRKDGFPVGTILDTRPGRVLVPVGNEGLAVFKVRPNGTAELRNVLNRR